MGEPSLIGRQAEVDAFADALAGATTGRGAILLLTGEPGAGKTALLDRFAQIAQRAGAAVAWATAPDAEGAPPFWPWVALLRGLQDAVASGPIAQATAALIEPPVGAESPEAARFRLFDRVARALTGLAGPLVLLLDDVHRADGGTLRLLEFVATSIRRSHVVLAVTARPVFGDGDAAAAFGALVRAGAVRLDLSPWTEAEVQLVLQRHGVQASAVAVRRLHATTGGNPFFVLELVRQAARSGSDLDLTAPAAVVDVLRAEMRRLDPAARDVVHLAAVWGQNAPVAILAMAAGLPMDAVMALAAPAFVELDQSGALRFRHDLVRDAVYGAISPPERHRLHGRLAAAIAASGLPLDDRVRHLAVHGCRARSDWDPTAAFACAVDAATAASARLAIESAAAFYALAEQVQPLLPPDPRRDLAFFLAYAEALTAAGRREHAARTLDAAVDLARRLDDAESLARAALVLGLGTETAGQADRAVGVLIEEALARLPAEAHALRARLLARRLWQTLAVSGFDERSEQLARAALAEARTAEDAGAIASALNALLTTIPLEGVTYRQAVAREIVTQATRARDIDLTFSGLLWAVHTALEAGDVPGAREAARRYEDLGDRYPLPYHAWYRWIFRAAFAFLDDRLDDARAAIAQLDPEATAQREFAWLLHWTQQLELAARTGDGEGFEEASDRVIAGLHGIWLEPAVRAHIAVMRGDRVQAAYLLARFIETLDAGPRDNDWLAGLVEAAMAACKLRAREHAGALLERLAPYADRWAVIANATVSRGPVAGILAGLSMLCGDGALAAAFERRARSAAAAAGTSGALFWMEGCLAAVRPAAGAAGLSPREVEILALLAAGLSNQEIADRLVISIRTVQRHVENIYAKTGARGRAAAAVFAARHGIVAPQDR